VQGAPTLAAGECRVGRVGALPRPFEIGDDDRVERRVMLFDAG
jgi:hypothetical protein